MAAVPELGEVCLDGQRGRYRLVRRLGQGAFAATYEGLRLEDEQPVVVKLLPLSGLAGWKAIDLFEREAAALRAIDHPNVPRWVDDFVLGGRDNPRGFAIVMDKIPGATLRDRARGGGFSPEQMLRWFVDVLGVLAALHRRAPPVIHRDVNPKNIVVRPDGSAALVDFGSVQASFQSARAAIEGTLTAAGTFGYAPMEQLLGRASPASDLYGLGMSYLAVATGREPSEMPLSGPGVDVARLLTGGPVPIPLVARMVDPDPELRLADAGWLLARLSGPAGRVGVGASAGAVAIGASVGLAAAGAQGGAPAGGAPAGPLALEDGAQSGTQPPELYLAHLRRRLAAEGFALTPGGEIGFSRLDFWAERKAAGLAGFGLCLAVAPADWIEGQPAGKPAAPVACALFAGAVVNQAPSPGRFRTVLNALARRPNVVVAVIVCGNGIGSLTLGNARGAVADKGDKRAVAAFVDVLSGRVHLVPSRSFLERPRPEVLEALSRLLACVPA